MRRSSASATVWRRTDSRLPAKIRRAADDAARRGPREVHGADRFVLRAAAGARNAADGDGQIRGEAPRARRRPSHASLPRTPRRAPRAHRPARRAARSSQRSSTPRRRPRTTASCRRRRLALWRSSRPCTTPPRPTRRPRTCSARPSFSAKASSSSSLGVIAAAAARAPRRARPASASYKIEMLRYEARRIEAPLDVAARRGTEPPAFLRERRASLRSRCAVPRHPRAARAGPSRRRRRRRARHRRRKPRPRRRHSRLRAAPGPTPRARPGARASRAPAGARADRRENPRARRAPSSRAARARRAAVARAGRGRSRRHGSCGNSRTRSGNSANSHEWRLRSMSCATTPTTSASAASGTPRAVGRGQPASGR